MTWFLTQPPSTPQNIAVSPEAKELLESAISWTLWCGLAASVLVAIVFAGLMALDKNRGQAWANTSVTTEAVGWALGIALMCSAGKIAQVFLL